MVKPGWRTKTIIRGNYGLKFGRSSDGQWADGPVVLAHHGWLYHDRGTYSYHFLWFGGFAMWLVRNTPHDDETLVAH